MKIEVERFKNFLDTKKMRFTKGRKAIIEELISLPDTHLDAEEILRKLREKGIGVSRATLYRTLSLLVKGGVLKAVSLGEGHSHFELGVSKKIHGHMICKECKKIIEFDSEEIKNFLEKLAKKKGFSIQSVEIEVFGVCKKHE
jgi:Fur family ferric uptake transcriptional regulator